MSRLHRRSALICAVLWWGSLGMHDACSQQSPMRGVSLQRNERPVGEATYPLTEAQGPWMIFAASFAGEGADDEANQLVWELRKRWRVPSYTYREHYDFTESVNGLGLNPKGEPLRMKHRLPIAYDEIAVLLGNFPTFDDPRLQQTLKWAKYCRPSCLELSGDKKHSTLRYAGLRYLQRKVQTDEAKKKKGPMGQAFVTRNPLLPEEFFAPQGIDSLVASMNEGVKHSLLDCPGEYTVQIATFRGTVVLDQRMVKEIEETGRMESRLAEAAEKAHLVTETLRKRGVEAYEFHDRHESLVTVGSFDSVGNPRDDGRIEINPAIHHIIQTYGATQKTLPGRQLAGLMPKTVSGVTLDVQPMPVQVPHRSIARDYDRSQSLLR